MDFTGSNSTDDTAVVTYAWDFDDGNTSSQADPVHTFTTAGDYTVQLTVTDGEGLTDTASITISVSEPNQPPVAVIAATPLLGQAPLDVSFTGSNSTDDIGVVSYAWDFDDGNNSSQADPVHTYNSAGIYLVELTVTDGEGLTNTTSITITVDPPANQPPVAVISATPISGVSPLEVTFTGSNSTDDTGVVSYAWDFGDGAVSTLADPVHTFTTADIFIVQLIVTDGDGLSDSTTFTISVAAPNGPPVAVIGATPLSGEAPLDVNFTGSNSTDDTGVVSYAWDFGDGAVSTLANPVHTFTTTGDFVVQLTVSDGDGLTDTTAMTISVIAPNTNQPPVAIIGASSLSGVAPLDVTFTGGNSTDDGGVVSYSWNFGDGAISTLANPLHTFTTAGTYLVELTISDEDGLTDTTTTTITVDTSVNQAPLAVISASITSGEIPLEVSFTGSNSTDDVGVVSYAWNFGDGAYTSQTNPVHTYKTTGVFEVTLTVTDRDGLEDSSYVTITVDKIASKMIVLLMENPVKLGMAKIQILNQPTDMKVMSIYCHDASGRLIRKFNPLNIVSDAGYEIPIYDLRNGVYYTSLIMNQGDPIVLKLIVRN